MLAHWINSHGGRQPSKVLVSQGVIEAIEEEGRYLGFRPREKLPEGKLHIMGVVVEADPSMEIGRIVE